MKKICVLLAIALHYLPLNAQEGKKDTVRVVILFCDTVTQATDRYAAAWRFAYSVRELHKNTEGVIEPYAASNFTYQEYWVHKFYLTEDKKPIPSRWMIWQSVIAK